MNLTFISNTNQRLINYSANLKKSRKFKQVLLLYLVNVVGIPIGIITSIVLTRFLGPQGYGDFLFINNIFSFSIIIFTFGLFQAGNRALVLNNDTHKAREYYGTEIVVLIGIFIVMGIALYVYGIFDNNLSDKGLQNLFFALIPFSWIILLLRYFETLFQADNRIKELAATRFLPKVGFLITAGIIYFGFSSYVGNRLVIVWIFRLLSFFVVYIIVIKRIRISFNNLNKRLREIWRYNKSFGFHVYTGSVFAVGFNVLTGVLISYFSKDNTGVGYYGLALVFAAPLALIPNVIATTHYKDFSTKIRMPRKLIFLTGFLSFTALIFIRIIVGPFIRYFYGTDFIPVINLNLLVSFGVLCHGFADFFNRFLGAHGKGKALRNSSFLIGSSLLILNLTFIPKYGETGAAYTKIFIGILYFLTMMFYYRKLVRELKQIENN